MYLQIPLLEAAWVLSALGHHRTASRPLKLNFPQFL